MKSETKSGTKFLPGDRVKANIHGRWITAEFLKYYGDEDESSCWCRWDDDGKYATIRAERLEFDVIHNSPLMKALR